MKKNATLRRNACTALIMAAFFCCGNTVVQAQKRFTISGHITDSQSGETLIGATIYDEHSQQGAISNSYGFYTLTLPQGAVSLTYSYVGYLPLKKELDLQRDTVINISLNSSMMLEEVVVTASDHKNTGIEATGMGIMDIPIAQIEHTPALLGETDVIRTLQLTPGVQSGLGGGAGLYVRGGNGDENLILLDGTPVYKVDHLFGFFSVFTPEAMKKVTFYKGSFPARYNGRLSSVIDVRTRDGNMQEYHGSASIGLLTSRINLEGPLVKDRTSFSLSARTTYIDWLARPFMSDDEKFGYNFHDINMKLNHKFSDRDRVYISLYEGKDKLHDKYKDSWSNTNETYGDNMMWGNTIGALRWNHIFSNKLFSNISASVNNYDMKLDSYDYYTYEDNRKEESKSRYDSRIRDWSLSMDMDYTPLPQHRIQLGASYTYHDFQPETASALERTGEDVRKYFSPGQPIFAHEALGYAEDEWAIGDKVLVQPGISVSLFSVKDKHYITTQPRLSLRWQMNGDWAVKAAYTEMSQYIHLLTSMPIAMPTDLWVPITDRIKPERARQISTGAYFTGWKGWQLSAEIYYKYMENVLEYKDGMSFLGFSGSWQDLVSMGTGRSAGLELMLKRTEGANTGWIAYTLSKSDRKFDKDSGVNDGMRFPYAYDRRHCINLVYNHRFNRHIDLDATWMYYSGGTATIATQKTATVSPDDIWLDDSYYVPSRNNYRLPASHTLCIGLNMRKQLKHSIERTWNVSVYNAYNAMNPTLVYHKTNDNGDIVQGKLVKYTLLPILPSFTLTYKF